MVNRDLQLITLPELFTLEVIIQEDVDSVCKVGAMEWNTDEEESDMEDGFALGEGDLTLVKARGSAYFAESSNKAMESARWAGDNECLDAVVKGDAKLGIVG